MRLFSLLALILLAVGCAKAAPKVVEVPKGCYYDGCNTCCPMEFGGVGCTLKACVTSPDWEAVGPPVGDPP